MMQLDLHIPTPRPLHVPHKAAEVLHMLKKKGRAGVTVADFPLNYALRSRISDLRKDDYVITTIETKGQLTRYVLMGEA